MAFRFLHCLAKAAAKNGAKFLLGLVPGAQVIGEIAADAWQDYRQQGNEDGLRAEIEGLAQAPTDQVRRQAKAAVAAEGANLTPPEQEALVTYLAQVPAMIRRSLRRPSDPSGTTTPANLALRRADDLLPFLPPRPPRFKPGDQPAGIGDRVLEELVGIGGFGEVWKARHAHMRSKPPVALKFCLDDAASKALRNEAGLLDRVMQHGKHPGIVPLWDTHLSAPTPCLEYEFVEGGDLASLIRELHAGGRPSVEVVNRLLLQLVEIVAFAHRANIVHDDLKPANVLARRTGDGGFDLRITDFGIGGLATAVAVRETRQPTRGRQELLTEAVRGAYTPLYASPEQMLRRPGEPADPRDDVHALGVIWYQLLTGDLTMLSVPPEWFDEVRKCGLGKGLIALLAGCIAAKAEKRPSSAVDLAGRLRKAFALPAAKPPSVSALPAAAVPAPPPQAPPAAIPVSAPPPAVVAPMPSPPPSPVSPKRVSRRVVLAAGGGGLLAVGLGALAWYKPQGDSKLRVSPKLQQAVWKSNNPGDVSTNTLGMKFAFVPSGSFWMGGGGGTPGDKQETISHNFYLGVYTITQGEWRMLMAGSDAGPDPSYFSRRDGRADRVNHVSDADLDRFPVETVRWDHVQEFIKRLNELERGSGWMYRLPTEVEWEYSCRGGASSKEECSFHFYFKEPTNDLSFDQANFDGRYPVDKGKSGEESKCTTKVGSFEANRLGLFDMHGNVWEWTDTLERSSRVIRGGSWDDYGSYCQAAYRSRCEPSNRYSDLGCRLARVPVQ